MGTRYSVDDPALNAINAHFQYITPPVFDLLDFDPMPAQQFAGQSVGYAMANCMCYLQWMEEQRRRPAIADDDVYLACQPVLRKKASYGRLL